MAGFNSKLLVYQRVFIGSMRKTMGFFEHKDLGVWDLVKHEKNEFENQT